MSKGIIHSPITFKATKLQHQLLDNSNLHETKITEVDTSSTENNEDNVSRYTDDQPHTIISLITRSLDNNFIQSQQTNYGLNNADFQNSGHNTTIKLRICGGLSCLFSLYTAKIGAIMYTARWLFTCSIIDSISIYSIPS